MASCLNCSKELLARKTTKYCSNSCQAEYQYRDYISEWKVGNRSGKKYEGEVSTHVRRWLHEQSNSKCSKCGWGETHPVTGKVPLQVNHISGNWNDNSPSNLELLCPNCHSLTPTYGKLNAGKGRKSRIGGEYRDRTDDLLRARQTLSQLS